MTLNRRQFLTAFSIAALTAQLPQIAQAKSSPSPIIKPPNLKVGDTVGLINPASPTPPEDIEEVKQTLTDLGLKFKLGAHLLDRYGYLAGKDIDRAADVNAMFADSSVKAIIAGRGGWGCNRILPLLDYKLIRNNPKIIMGYSDITSLLLAIYAKSGIVTFHGPVGTSTWNQFTVNYVKRILFNGEAVTMQNPSTSEEKLFVRDCLKPTAVLVETITPGKAKGKLVGGNLSVLAAMVGSPYLPDWKKTILFVEEVEEEVYRVDRMLTQLKLAGILDQIAGFIFGQCTDCNPKNPEKSLTLNQVLREHILPLGIPAWYGSAIGHIPDKFTLPIGVEAEIDASAGTIQMLESATKL
ncbi:S66 peptidase family protein [Argonema antarcticum]|uniref:S66 peptidase family protein n=1 Tax=Argonema antarcticum TaxID=2942763 RepID=UPI002012E106|nr:LD-carboxypeptidase [Argonema antarcticum]MCL1472656.1 LD-carboxypeptidase [Argonema antarcticum A004/B2]